MGWKLALFDVLFFLLLLLLISIYFGVLPEDICYKSKEATQENCAPHSIGLRAVIHIATLLTEWSDATIALATIVVAWFTGTLWRSTSKLSAAAEIQGQAMDQSIAIANETAAAAKRSADIAEATLVATQRPWVKTSFQLIKPISKYELGIEIWLEVTAKVFGQSPVVALHLWASQMPDDFDGVNIAPIAEKYLSIWVKGDGGTMLMPGESHSQNWRIPIRKPKDFSFGKEVFHILAGVVYRFPFGPYVPRYNLTHLILSDARIDEDIAEHPDEIPIGNVNTISFRSYTT